jgi:8-oxo-dGTP pyrophosphatase MutT (NUDIX family)
MRTVERDIVGTFIFSNDGFTLLGKSREGGVYPGFWVVPGGGVEPGETFEEGAARETREEVGIDIYQGKITSMAHDVQTGESEKTLRTSGERVLMRMRFHDFVVHLPFPAVDIAISLDDDLCEAAWHPTRDLGRLPLTPGVLYRYRQLGYMSSE